MLMRQLAFYVEHARRCPRQLQFDAVCRSRLGFFARRVVDALGDVDNLFRGEAAEFRGFKS